MSSSTYNKYAGSVTLQTFMSGLLKSQSVMISLMATIYENTTTMTPGTLIYLQWVSSQYMIVSETSSNLIYQIASMQMNAVRNMKVS